MTIQEIFDQFDNQVQESLANIAYVNSRAFVLADTNMQDKVKALVIMQSFLSVYAEWEHFLENSTIWYAMGEPSIKGKTPTKYIYPVDEDHANQIICGASKYPDWSNLEYVLKTENYLFEQGEPYKSALNGFSSVFTEIKKVRNVIAHNSKKSHSEFDTLVRNKLNPSYVGIRPTEFLLQSKGGFPAFYRQYITHLHNAAMQIANYQ
jgi:hypothetical protein